MSLLWDPASLYGWSALTVEGLTFRPEGRITVARPCRIHTGVLLPSRSSGSYGRESAPSMTREVTRPMTVRLVLVAHAATEATRRARLHRDDEPLDPHGFAVVSVVRGVLCRVSLV